MRNTEDCWVLFATRFIFMALVRKVLPARLTPARKFPGSKSLRGAWGRCGKSVLRRYSWHTELEKARLDRDSASLKLAHRDSR
jgi:hypothetical protein